MYRLPGRLDRILASLQNIGYNSGVQYSGSSKISHSDYSPFLLLDREFKLTRWTSAGISSIYSAEKSICFSVWKVQ